jgi:hypothetical protein
MNTNTVDQKPEWLRAALAAADQNVRANMPNRDPFERPKVEAAAIAGLIAILARELHAVAAQAHHATRLHNQIAKLERTACGLSVELFPVKPKPIRRGHR